MNRDRNQVVLVDTENRELGTMEKYEAHKQGSLHRAFSIFIFNDNGELLLQQRASHKYHGANLWTNTCCSHQQLGESTLDAARDRLIYEMNLSAELEEIFSFIYHAHVENNLIEHELDSVLFGINNDIPIPNPEEVQNYRWIAAPDLENWMASNPEQFTYWFKDVWHRVKEYMQQEIAAI
ncbi:isopentenyl-diphosphate Delta-isomerase [Sphingobacterium bovistauri]|uniref:Isopentenyl-diphosphate delta-isomerase n=1 Tax=Sphingobacterium bovistauri TaxID=2781959 RepID=A0ABS7Z6F3_9SPHI|nr:isopentenyl-diphosphate Delta-isomerase [Sphingobacterium bovistauri]MCA5005749.1 isopentenyl-diphosphate Delta-isomerase [Sphingobacterium bovistauri]